MVGKMRWGDSVELDDDGDFEMALPPPQVRDRDPARVCACSSTVAAKKIWPLSPPPRSPPADPLPTQTRARAADHRTRRERCQDGRRVPPEGRREQGACPAASVVAGLPTLSDFHTRRLRRGEMISSRMGIVPVRIFFSEN